MDADELAIKAKGREEWALLELWEAVKRFTAQEALKYLQRGDNAARIEYDDLMQAGFMAMIEAADYYTPAAGAGFLTVYKKYFLKRAFAEAGGHRTAKRDPLLYAESLDVPAWAEDPEAESAKDLVEDPKGEYAFLFVEYYDFIEYCHKLIITAMGNLTYNQYREIYLYYFHGKSGPQIAGYKEGREKVRACIDRGLRHLRHGKYQKQLKEALQGFEDFREIKTDMRLSELKMSSKRH